MFEKLTVLVIIFIAAIAYETPKLRHAEHRERIVYSCIMLVAVYFAIDYLLAKNLPDPVDFLDWTITEPAKIIVGYLEGSS
ncbi:hypothetical protein [Bacillus solitudinis]|uniref:hypothetical protein n=1 Tax=Bacillus solitudinis TaxID=2014074 RepID=UPI000C23C596|nr:hypothetical protein [Bacillus solitudinis]